MSIEDRDFEEKIKSLCQEMLGEEIKMTISFGETDFIIYNCNIIGDIMENIFFRRTKDKINIEEGPKQRSPDFYVDKEKVDGINELELKSFKDSPGFDIGNYGAFIEELNKDGGVYRKFFRTKYMIFEYEEKEIENGTVAVIKSFYYKSLWEILTYENKYPIPIQNKRGSWTNIRPGNNNTWDDTNKTPNQCIKCIIHSISLCPNMDDKENKINRIKQQWEEIRTSHQGLNLQPLE